jgi:hypothetical protein
MRLNSRPAFPPKEAQKGCHDTGTQSRQNKVHGKARAARLIAGQLREASNMKSKIVLLGFAIICINSERPAAAQSWAPGQPLNKCTPAYNVCAEVGPNTPGTPGFNACMSKHTAGCSTPLTSGGTTPTRKQIAPAKNFNPADSLLPPKQGAPAAPALPPIEPRTLQKH